MSDDILIEAHNLKKHFPIRGGMFSKGGRAVRAVDDVSFFIRKGETLGLVGESGCGKTTTGRAMLHLTRPTGGNIYWKLPHDLRKKLSAMEDRRSRAEERLMKERELQPQDLEDIKLRRSLYRLPGGDELQAVDQELAKFNKEHSLEGMDEERLRLMRKNMQIVFQDPYSSLNPRMLIKDIITEPLLVHGVAHGEEMRERARAMIDAVGLNPEHLYRYPHEFSGGQRQRIGVARALMLNPELIVLDEPTSALDMSVQAQILNMLNDLQRNFGLTYLFISHDLSTIHYMCDRINVMYLGKVVESAPRNSLFAKPTHPYTQALLASIPVPDPAKKKQRVPLAGEIPSPANPPSGCRFHTRCKFREAICETTAPPLVRVGEDHFVACHLCNGS
ncbi:hypothetical protein AOA80_06430 [Methanomassiliicoccales archaeon RumEn M1]|nr:hypothetical protein AOA80_06430 [Methanomassiliicoccales archaeon RumEn M1]